MSDIFFVATTASAAWFYRVRAFLWSVLQFQSSLAHEIWHWELFCIFGRLWTSFMICTLWNYAHSLAFSTFRTLQYSSASIYQKPQFWWVDRSKMEFGAQEGPLIIKSGCLGSCNNKIARTNFWDTLYHISKKRLIIIHPPEMDQQDQCMGTRF